MSDLTVITIVCVMANMTMALTALMTFRRGGARYARFHCRARKAD